MEIHAQELKLIEQINQTRTETGTCAIWWLGQHSFVGKFAGKVIYFDPFLTEIQGRQIPPLFAPEQVTNADYIFGSHDHADHIDRPVWPAMAEASPNAKFVVPELLRENLIDDLGIEASRFIGLDDGQMFEADGVRITAVAAAHEFLDRDQASGQYPYLGFIVEANGCCVYHAGDTCIYEGLSTKLRAWQFDLMMLPINGRDAVRLHAGCMGNMTYQEAVDLAGTLETKHVIPTHYDMFKENPGDVDGFVAYLNEKFPRVKAIVPGYADRVMIK